MIPDYTPAHDESPAAPAAAAPEKEFVFEYCRIFPPIGIARVGNSPEEFFIGPEAPGVPPENGGSFKDARGRVKRQAARFRVYGFGRSGEVAELSLSHPAVEAIEWTVTLANKKAAWYRFDGTRLVASILRGTPAPPEKEKLLRNDHLAGPARDGLEIHSAATNIAGTAKTSPPLQGSFRVPLPNEPTAAEPKIVVLGHLRTDEAGRLLVLGGAGHSESLWPDNPLTNYANNNGWHDDASDGPVTVVVKLKGGTTLPVRGRSWVIVAPPHYSPHTKNPVTLYEVLAEAATEHGLAWEENELGPKPDAKVSFTRDIFPIIERLAGYQWVSRRAHRGHSPGKRGDLFSDETLRLLANKDVAAREGSPHKHIFSRVRTPLVRPPFEKKPHAGLLDPVSQEAVNQANLSFMPPLSGDEGDVAMDVPETWFFLTETQYRQLSVWKDGDFDADWKGWPEPAPFDAISVERQPLALTIAALETCQGGAFFPGIEMTSVVRFKEFYSDAFRVSDQYKAGDVTKWMALPWQADFYECGAHWWPTIRPDDVVPGFDFDAIVAEFQEEVGREHLASLLHNRKRWDRGIGMELPARPSLPDVNKVADTAAYQRACQRQIDTFTRRLIRNLPEPRSNEFRETFRRRIEELLDRTILEPSVPGGPPAFVMPDFQIDPKTGQLETPQVFRERTAGLVQTHIRASVAVPVPAPGETLLAYAARLDEVSTENAIWQGLFDVAWAWRDVHRGKNDMIERWSQLGFVVPRVVGAQRYLVEGDRGRFDLIPFRESFHFLMNIEDHPEFLGKARELADEYFRLARDQQDAFRDQPRFEQYRPFKYDEITFRARLEKIYELERRSGEDYNPATGEGEPVFRTPTQIVERIRQLAPFNQLDGSWLERIAKSGPIDEVRSFLFEIWSDEIGNGDPAQNHANVYTNLMQTAGIYLPPLNSRAYADHPDLWDSSFSSPAYQSSAALFPENYYPELLGMTLYLEWEAVYLPAMVKLYEFHGYPSIFYRLHVAIDNPVNGHGARARDAVVRYLDHIRGESGEEEMQQHWKRIWDGYIAFRFIGGDEWEYRFKNPPSPDERMIEMMIAKRHYAQLNHGTKRFGSNFLNDWFDEPDQFLAVLRDSDLIVKGDSANSRMFSLMAPNGVMFKVFNGRDLDTWRAWIDSLPRDPVGGALDPGEAMTVLIREFANRAMGVPEHGGYELCGYFADPAQENKHVQVTQSVIWWFQINQPERFMAALADPGNGWIIPGNVAKSRFVTELLAGGRMARFLAQPITELGGKPAREIIVQWIAANCPIPGQPEKKAAPPAAAAAPAMPVGAAAMPRVPRENEVYASDFERRTAASQRVGTEQRRGLRRRYYGPGGGAAH